MTNPRKAQGDRAERAVVAYLQQHWSPTVRRTKAGGEKDLGDLSGVVDRYGDLWCVQVADRRWTSHAQIEAKAAEAAEQAERLLAGRWCLLAKRPRAADVGDWFVWLPMFWLPLYGDWLPLYCESNARDLACITVRAWVGIYGPQT